MALAPFETDDDTYTSSITMDASTVGDTTVTVAVHAPREREPDILTTIYEHGDAIGFKPFYDKANDYEYPVRREFTEGVLRNASARIVAFSHRHLRDGNQDTQQVEAVHSAIHVHDLLEEVTELPVVIVDGNEQQAEPFVKALSGLREDRVPVAHCLQSEYYYPTALLADLTSNYLAHRAEELGATLLGDDLIVPAPRAKQVRGDDWGVAINATYEHAIDYSPLSLPGLQGETVRERINCWFQGVVATDSGVDRPMSDSLTRVAGALRRHGHSDLATVLEDL